MLVLEKDITMIDDFDDVFEDGIFAFSPPDKFDWAGAIKKMKMLGRTLTDEETQEFEDN